MKKIDNLDSLLSSDNLNSSVIELDNFICELCEWGDNMDTLTEAQKNFYYNQKQIEETANEKWEELDQKFFEYKDDLNSLNIEYVKKHRTEF